MTALPRPDLPHIAAAVPEPNASLVWDHAGELFDMADPWHDALQGRPLRQPERFTTSMRALAVSPVTLLPGQRLVCS